MTAFFPMCLKIWKSGNKCSKRKMPFLFCPLAFRPQQLHPSYKEDQFFIQTVQLIRSVVLILHFWVVMMLVPVGKVHWIQIRHKRSTLSNWKRAGWKLHTWKYYWNIGGSRDGCSISHAQYIFNEQHKRERRRGKIFLLDYFL